MARSVCVLALVLCLARASAAQTPPDDPVAEAPIRFGVLGLAPTLSVTNLGIDTNVFNNADNPQRDFTVVGSPGLSVWLRTQGGLLSVNGRMDLVYFNKFVSERSVNGLGSATYEYRFNRLRPFVTFGGETTRERPGYEVDIRARRIESTLKVGMDLRVASKSYLVISGRRLQVDYAGDAVFDGRPLNEAFNRTLESVDLGWRQRLTVLTTWVVRATAERERFELDQRRNGDSTRVSTGFELGRLALIRGQAFVGYRRLVGAEGGTIPEFSGVTADVNVSYNAPSQTRLSVAVNRDVEYSFQIDNPYYVQTGWTATVTQRMVGRWDVQLSGGRDRLAYAALDPVAGSDRNDRVERIGGGTGYQLRPDVRVSVDVNSFHRRSHLPGRDYKALRAGVSVTYGF
jgi:hypothetical protein